MHSSRWPGESCWQYALLCFLKDSEVDDAWSGTELQAWILIDTGDWLASVAQLESDEEYSAAQ